MKVLVVLYVTGDGRQTYCIYYGGTDEADSEFEIMASNDPKVRERGRIWVTSKAKLENWADL